MENNKIFKITGLVNDFKALLGIVAVNIIVPIGIITQRSTYHISLIQILTAILLFLIIGIFTYVFYKEYTLLKGGITVDIENDKFIYPIKTTLWNLNQKNIREISLHSIFAISAKDNVVRKSDGKVRYYYNITIQSNEVDYPIGYSFYSSGNRDRLYSILKSVNGLD